MNLLRSLLIRNIQPTMQLMLKRKIYKKLLEWKNGCQGKRALLIEGARRIGKSTIAKNLEKRNTIVIFLLTLLKKIRKLRGILRNI